MTLTLATYNIHRCHGRDGVHDPARIRKVLRQTAADVVALQEVELLRDEPGLLDYLCEDSPWTAIHGPTLERENAEYGNAVLTSLPLQSLSRIDISQPGREHRGALDLVLKLGTANFRLVATHLGLWPAERRAQVRQLLRSFRGPTGREQKFRFSVLMGDLNEWFLWGRPLLALKRHFRLASAPATFPSAFPLFALDRIWVEPGDMLAQVQALKNPLSRVASDHLPLVAHLRTESA